MQVPASPATSTQLPRSAAADPLRLSQLRWLSVATMAGVAGIGLLLAMGPLIHAKAKIGRAHV